MDKLVMLVTLLLVAVHEDSASDFPMLSLDEVWCNNTLTVVLAAVEDAYGNGTYQMILGGIHKDGQNNLTVYLEEKITMEFPLNGSLCGHTFPEDTSISYFIAGHVSLSGILHSTMCLYMQLETEVFSENSSSELVLGERQPTCES